MEQASLSKYWQPILLVWLQMMDCITTMFAINHLGATELNPVVASVLAMPFGWLWMFLGKVVLGGAMFVWLWIRKSTVVVWFILSFYTLVVAWNVSLICLALLA